MKRAEELDGSSVFICIRGGQTLAVFFCNNFSRFPYKFFCIYPFFKRRRKLL